MLAAAAIVGGPACSGKFEFDIPRSSAGAGGGGIAAGVGGGVPPSGSSAGGAMAGLGDSRAAAGAGGTESKGLGGEDADETCGSDPPCPAPLHCADGECRECVVDQHCSSPALPRCDPERHRCVACLDASDCDAGFACDSLANRCLRRCGEGLPCPADLHGCDEGRGVCYECDEDYECSGAASGQLCASDGSGCVQCRSDQDCSAQHCDPLSGRCVECRDGRDCDSGSCEPALHTCLTR